MTRAEKLTIAQGICAPLLRKIRADLQRNADLEEDEDEEDQTGIYMFFNITNKFVIQYNHVRCKIYTMIFIHL